MQINVMVEWLLLAVPWGCLRYVIVVFPDHTQLQFLAESPSISDLVVLYRIHKFGAQKNRLDVYQNSHFCQINFYVLSVLH